MVMSEKSAKTHNHVSNRARNKSGGERKVVFKGFLDNPFRIQWPIVANNVQKAVLDTTVDLLSGIGDYRTSHNRKRTLAQQEESRKRRKQFEANADRLTVVSSETINVDNALPNTNLTTTLERPSVSKHLIVGINEVTKRLEQKVYAERVTRVTLHSCTDKSPSCSLAVILVCRSDINPPILVDHLPHLVAALNSLRPEQPVRLVPLQPGAETLLSQALGLRRAAVLGFDSDCPNLQPILKLLRNLPTLSATWLASSVPIVEKFVPTHVKQVRTSVPKDMKAEKQRRKEEKTLKKTKRRSTSNKISNRT
ncbi:hypothetical protein H2248_001158 [Termitomyces sp. 'cryptogamus']|nr:hypothetical protein H2248_001158 [Termitomyces sp. 'cryptogamus']